MVRRNYFGLVLLAFGLMAAGRASAQGKTFAGEGYSITFSSTSWDTVKSRNIIASTSFFAIASMGASPATGLPDLDSMTNAYADTLGGKIAKDSSGEKALGKYQVHWQKYTYDSLPKLSAIITASAPFIPPLKKGSFRIYYLYHGGFEFTIACMSILPNGVAPYDEIEKAIATLKLGSEAGIVDMARAAGRDLWIRDGVLGGAWLNAHRPASVEGFDARGARVGSAAPTSEGTWALPASKAALVLRVRTTDGLSVNLPVRP
jgi:hypothetical protein